MEVLHSDTMGLQGMMALWIFSKPIESGRRAVIPKRVEFDVLILEYWSYGILDPEVV